MVILNLIVMNLILPMDSIQSLTVWYLDNTLQSKTFLKESRIYEVQV